MAAQNRRPLLKTEAECTFIGLMDDELEMIGEELLLVKHIINARGNRRMMTKQMAPLKELDSAQESIIKEFYQRLERECAYDRLLLNQDGLVLKIEKFQDMLAGFKYVYERIFSKEAEKTEFLSDLAIKQGWIIHVLELELMSEKQGRNNSDKKIKELIEELDRWWNKQQAEVEDFRRRIHESENELRNAVSQLRKEECARNELLFKNSNLNFDILKLKEQLTAVKYDYQKIIEEKEELKQRLAEDAWNSAGDREIKTAAEKPVTLETVNETKLNASRRQMSERDERDYQSDQQLRNREKELDEILYRLEAEKKTSMYEQLLKNLESLDDNDLAVSRPMNVKSGSFATEISSAEQRGKNLRDPEYEKKCLNIMEHVYLCNF